MSTLEEHISDSPVLVGENLRLRRFTLRDTNELTRLHQDPSITRWLLDDASLADTSVTTRFIRGLNKFYTVNPGLGIWAFERFAIRYTREQLLEQGADKYLDEEGFSKLLLPQWQLQGWFNLTPEPENPDQIELGSRLHKSAWGQGIACAVGEKLVSYAFETLSVTSLSLNCHPQNQPALYCAAYLGFEYPKRVEFLSSDAINLVSTAVRLAKLQAMSDSQRRRHSLMRVRNWLACTYRISA